MHQKNIKTKCLSNDYKLFVLIVRKSTMVKCYTFPKENKTSFP